MSGASIFSVCLPLSPGLSSMVDVGELPEVHTLFLSFTGQALGVVSTKSP